MTERRLTDVFVIYARDDGDRAAALCRALRGAGLRVFSDHDLRPGDIWSTVLPRRLRSARAVAVLISRQWPTPGDEGETWYGPEEVALAIDGAREVAPPPRLIPIWLDGAVDRTPYGLRRVTGVHVGGDAFAAAATDIAAVIDPTLADAPHEPKTAIDAARERFETLRADGASAETVERARVALLDERRAERDGPAPRAGDVFAHRYALLDRLGDGGFATVWLARDRQSGELIALKVLHGRWRHDRSRVERFERGAARMASLDHPSVVRVLAMPASYRGWHYYVMEYLPGGDLATARTRVDDAVSVGEAIEAVLSTADALAVAHGLGMVHRDVKPHNIVLSADRRAKLTDFDLVGAADSTGGTRTGALGTFLFAAPEALADAKEATAAADVYGLAVTTVFALLGRVPAAVVRAPDSVVAGLDTSAAVKALLLRSLAWDPAERPADAGVFAAALRRALGIVQVPPALHGSGVASHLGGGGPSGRVEQRGASAGLGGGDGAGEGVENLPPHQAQEIGIAVRWWVAAILAVAVGALVGLGWIWQSGSDDALPVEGPRAEDAMVVDASSARDAMAVDAFMAQDVVLADAALPVDAKVSVIDQSVQHPVKEGAAQGEKVAADRKRNRARATVATGSVDAKVPATDQGHQHPVEDGAAQAEKVAAGGKRGTARVTEAAASASRDYDDYSRRGLEAMGKGDRAGAAVLFEKAKNAKPSAKRPYQRLCAVYNAQGDYARALPNCEKWLQVEEDLSYKRAIQRTIDQIKDRLGQ